MTPKELKDHKLVAKQLSGVPVFKALKRGKLPKPLHQLGGPRVRSTGMLEVSADHVVVMYWRDGAIFTDRSFYGYLFCRLRDGGLSPIFEFHWHPSHKGFHCKMPCKTTPNYTNRMLPGAPELALRTKRLDPKNEQDLVQLVHAFCMWCGISPPDEQPELEQLWR